MPCTIQPCSPHNARDSQAETRLYWCECTTTSNIHKYVHTVLTSDVPLSLPLYRSFQDGGEGEGEGLEWEPGGAAAYRATGGWSSGGAASGPGGRGGESRAGWDRVENYWMTGGGGGAVASGRGAEGGEGSGDAWQAAGG